jgi:16S rRNA (uracil1498-N3)-methyltransferase
LLNRVDPGDSDDHHTAPRLFVSAALREGAEIAARPEQAHYLGTVLRRGAGDVARLFNGVDGEWMARLTSARRDRAILSVERQLRPQTPEAGPWLLFSLLKRDATDLVVRQAVELGASRVLPVLSDRTNAARVNEARLRAIAIEAAEQCERMTVPAIDPPARLEGVLAAWSSGRRLFVALERSWAGAQGDDAGRGPSGGAVHPGRDGPVPPDPVGGYEIAHGARDGGTPRRGRDKAALLIGPEGGFTPAEREMLSRLAFVTPISLGPFVLRAETAAAAGQALLLGMGWAEYAPST